MQWAVFIMAVNQSVNPSESQSVSAVDRWFLETSDKQRSLLEALRQLIRTTNRDLVEELKWNQPCYKLNRPVCYLNKSKTHVVLGFQQGANLPDPKGLLEGTGKDMRHIKIPLDSAIDAAALKKLISAAIKLDRAA